MDEFQRRSARKYLAIQTTRAQTRDMTAVRQALNCGATACDLSAGVRVKDAGMEFVRCPTCRVLHIPPENLVHSKVLPDPVEKLSTVMKILLSMRMRWLRGELPQLDDKDVRIADVGCGDGQFLEFLSMRGYSKIIGIEPDAVRAFNARKRGLAVRRVPTRGPLDC
jgi:SAM-dependent methyltransferase